MQLGCGSKQTTDSVKKSTSAIFIFILILNLTGFKLTAAIVRIETRLNVCLKLLYKETFLSSIPSLVTIKIKLAFALYILFLT